MTESRLPSGGGNKFQKVKENIKNARNAGIKIIDLSIGQPRGAAFLSARQFAAATIMSDDPAMHSYQDNDCVITDFARLFAEAHIIRKLGPKDYTVPVPGIKPMLKIIPEACGSQFKDIKVGIMKGYPTPEDACKTLKVKCYILPTTPENDFKFSPEDIEPNTDLLMLNYPHNPSGVVVNRAWWEKICEYCEKNNIRIFNDEAYQMLAYSEESCSLADIAPKYAKLSWAVGYSASKVGNFTGWRVGLIIGSRYFIEDIKKCKGNADSGLVAAMAAGVLEAIINSKSEIHECRQTYIARQRTLINILSRRYGMKLAVAPGAGFFSLWKVPLAAFGQKIESAEHFNDIMTKNTGVAGVPFDPGFIRYSVTENIHAPGIADAIAAAFAKANISYS